jgi:predicted TPR repeat methyltransferase
MDPDPPSDAEAFAKVGDVLLARGETEQAIASYDQALALNPQLFETHLSLAAAKALQGKLAEATVSCRNAISLNPNHSNAHNELGCLLERQGKLDEASTSFQKAIALDPNHVNSHNNLATLLGRQGRLDEALASLQKVLALDPNHCDAHCNLGNVLLHQGKLDDAFNSYQRVLALNPNHIHAHNNLGALLERQGRLEEALASLRKAFSLNPNHSSAHNNLSSVLQKQGRLEDAIATCRRALDIRPDDVKAHETLGLVFHSKGELSEAASHYQRAIELGTPNPMIRHALAALNGEDAGPIPTEVVTGSFDDYASRFDTHLVGALGYSAPKLMREAVDRLTRNNRRFQHALDLGCGTGLVGEHFRDIVTEIDGVDLSPKMLEQARRKQIYSRLDREEIVAWLERSATEALSFDIVVSADVFIYVGNLEPAFKAVRTILAHDGLFVFSVEHLAQGSFELLPTLRYAHSISYVRELASRHRFTVEVCEQFDLRRDKSAIIGGTIFVMTRQ